MSSREMTLLALQTITANVNGAALGAFSSSLPRVFQLKVAGPVTGTLPTLDVKIQHSIDGGTTWFDLVTFTQRTTTGSELKNVSPPMGATLRAVATVGGSAPSFGAVEVRAG